MDGLAIEREALESLHQYCPDAARHTLGLRTDRFSDFSKAYALIHETEPDHLTALKLLEPDVCSTPRPGDSPDHYALAESWANVCREHLGLPPRHCVHAPRGGR